MAMVSSFLDLAPHYTVKNYIAQQAAAACTELSPNRTAAFASHFPQTPSQMIFMYRDKKIEFALKIREREMNTEVRKTKVRFVSLQVPCALEVVFPPSFPLIFRSIFTQRDERNELL